MGKLGFFYIFGTNVTYILILLLGIFFFINGPFWSIFNITKNNEDLYNNSFNINSSDKSVSFIKLISLPLNYIVFFYKNIVFSLFFQSSNSFFNSISFNKSILLINYKKNLFKSLTNYSIVNNFSTMYDFIQRKELNTDNLLFVLPYNFGLNTVITTFSASDLKKSLKYFPFFLSIFFFYFSIKYYRYYTL